MIQQLQHQSNTVSSASLAEPVVLCAADDNYVRPLAVTLQSAAQNLRAGNKLQVIVLDGGISDENWIGLKETMADLPIELFSIRPDVSEVADLATSHHITHSAYLRLLAGRLLPESVEKAIYLDSDLLVCDDLSELWEIPLDGQLALAVPDIACPYVDARRVDCNFAKSSPYMATISPIPNWQQLGLSPDEPYFNSGVMVLNVSRMREENLEHALIQCLRTNQRHVWCWDQYALNVVFAGQWNPLPLKWNQGAHLFEFPSNDHCPIDQDEFEAARTNPSIIHYTTEWKPWRFGNRHPLKHKYFEQLDQTAWSGWRPVKPDFSFAMAWQEFATEFVKRWTIGYRKLTAVFHQPTRPTQSTRPSGQNGTSP